ncbi:MAG: signal transduction histidine kinase/predicted ATPase [Myxococcota bacterium]|jgi:signal transduction histidine kinase/predicted ATPase
MEQSELLYHSDRTLVVRGRHPVYGDVVLKTTTDTLPAPIEIARYRHEYRALTLLDGAGSASAVGLEEQGGRPLLFLEDTGGTTLLNELRPDPTTLCGWLIQLTAALEKIHHAGIIHRDLSLSNLIRSRQTGDVSIIDFGESAILTGNHTDVAPPAAPRGTLAYISPEQTGRVGRRVDARTDLYSLGACLWHLLVGRPLFDTADSLGQVHAHLAQSPQPPRIFRSDCPESLSAIIMKLLEKDPADRYQSAASLLVDARQCAADPEEVFSLGRADRAVRFVYPSELFGRDAAHTRLREAYARIRAGQHAAVLISGADGVGKRTLAVQLSPLVALDQGFFTAGACELDSKTPYQCWIAALRGLLRSVLSRDDAVMAAHREALQAVLSQSGRAQWAAALPELAVILGPTPLDAQPPALSPGATRAHVHTSITALLRVLCASDRPVVLVLEDLQWIDAASSQLLQTVLSEHIPGLLLLATDRTDGASLDGLTLLPLDVLSADSVCALLASCCRCAPGETAELTAVLMVKTGGNPRRLRSLIERAIREGWLHPTSDGWHWDRQALSEVESAEDDRVLLGALDALPPDCQHTLSAGALLGQGFSLHALSVVLEQDAAVCRSQLLPAVDALLLLPVGTDRFRFGQERLRQHCEDQLPEAERVALHRAVGWVLVGEEQWFEAVRHLHIALPILEKDARLRLAMLAREAGDRAWSSAAFQAASDCFDAGTHALGVEGWSAHYDLMLALTTGACQAARLSGQSERRDHHIAALMENTRTIADQAAAWLVRVNDALDANQHMKAITISDGFLRLTGSAQITRIRPLALLVSFFQVLFLLRGRSPETLEALPTATDPLAIATQRIHTAVAEAQFQATPQIIPQAIIRDVHHVLRDGVTAWGAHCWTGVAMLLIMGPQWVGLGTRFGQLSLDQVIRLNRPDLWPKVAFVQTFAILPWSTRHRELIQPMDEVATRAFAVGDLSTAMTARLVRDSLLLLTGTPLDEVQAALADSAAQARRHRTRLNANTFLLFEKLLRQLRGESIPDDQESLGTTEERAIWQGASLISGLVQGTEIDWTVLEQPMMRAPVVAFPHLYLWTYAGVAALHRRRKGELSASRATAVYWRARRKVKRWVRHRPARGYRLDWLRAERRHQQGMVRPALRLYEAALKGARAEGIHLDAALIAEHAAELCAETGLERMASAMSREALGEYRSWGATARIATMETTKTASSRSHHSTSSTNVDTLDLLSIVRASQALSEEVTYSGLLDRIMGTLLENTGATSGLVVLDEPGGPQVAAQASVAREAISLPCPLVGSGLGPETLIQFVIRTGEEVVISDGIREDAWFPDPLVRRPRAVLCTPIGRGGTVHGAIYLENALVPGCFTRERLEAAHLLMSQVSISLENAGLVEGLEVRVAQRTEELEAARQHAESASQAKSTFLANMSHELRTPLNAILGYAQLLKEGTNLAPKQRDGLHTIYRSGTHLLGLINDVLDMSRIEAGRFELEEAPTQTAALLTGVVDIFRVSAEKKGIALSLHLDSGLPSGIMVDARRMRQLLLNLIGNAVKFTDQGGVSIAVAQADGMLLVAITDTGPGIPASMQETIFEAFEQAGGAQQRAKGTGLGLAITRQIATRMGGTIAVTSTTVPPSGSTFTITLPLRSHDVVVTSRPAVVEATIRAAEPMTIPDAATLHRLLERVQVGDLRAVAERAETLTEHPVFARRLLTLTRDFDDHGLESFLEGLLAD